MSSKLLFAFRLLKQEKLFDRLNKLASKNNIQIDYPKFMQEIINRAFSLYGQLALEEINSVKGLKVSPQGRVYSVTENIAEIIDDLAKVYENLVGNFDRFILNEELRELLLKENIFTHIKEIKNPENITQ